MTWYAHQVFAQPRTDVIASLQAVSEFAGGLYYVPDLAEWESSEQIVDGVLFGEHGPMDMHRTIRRGPQLPIDGLVVVRELCSHDQDSHCFEWFGKDAVEWKGIGRGLAPSDNPVLDLESVFADAPDWWRDAAPPANTLVQLQHIAFTTKSTVAYYCCHMWGGDVECVFGWVWDGERQYSAFYRGKVAEDKQGRESTGFYTDMIGAVAVDGFGRRFIANGDVLTLLLLHFNLLLQDGYFELHTRAFPWDRYAKPLKLPNDKST
jgi:hypothetical protein